MENNKPARQDLLASLKSRILVLDGATGTQLQRHRLKESDYRGQQFRDHPLPLAGNFDLLTLTQPDILENLHRAYLEAGADIISTNTFNATAIAQGDYGTEDQVGTMNRESAHLARRAVTDYVAANPNRRRFVAGVVGPTPRISSEAPPEQLPSFQRIDAGRLYDAYRDQIAGLLEGGVDMLLIETVYHTANLRAALAAARDVVAAPASPVPIWISATLDRSGRGILSGETLESYVTAAASGDPFCVGLNCGYGCADMRAAVEQVAAICEVAVSVHPNAGLPDQYGRYPETPDILAARMQECAKAGLINIGGGCCGTTPEHIAALTSVLAGILPRPLP